MSQYLKPDQLEQVKHLMRAIWSHYSDEFGYRSEKIAVVDRVTKPEQSYMLVQMFDASNRLMLLAAMRALRIQMPADWGDLFDPGAAA